MDQYKRTVVGQAPSDEALPDNEIRPSSQGKINAYVKHAVSLLQEADFDRVVLCGKGKAINKTVTIAEILKRQLPNLYQDTRISSEQTVDQWEPGSAAKLDTLQVVRHIPVITIVLSKQPIDPQSVGFQAPIQQNVASSANDQHAKSNFGGRGSKSKKPRRKSESEHTTPPKRTATATATTSSTSSSTITKKTTEPSDSTT